MGKDGQKKIKENKDKYSKDRNHPNKYRENTNTTQR